MNSAAGHGREHLGLAQQDRVHAVLFLQGEVHGDDDIAALGPFVLLGDDDGDFGVAQDIPVNRREDQGVEHAVAVGRLEDEVIVAAVFQLADDTFGDVCGQDYLGIDGNFAVAFVLFNNAREFFPMGFDHAVAGLFFRFVV